MLPVLDVNALSVCGDVDMPHRDAIYDEIRRSPSFAEAIAHARAESAHGLAMQVVEIADAAGPGDNPQLVKNRCDQRRWLAGKYNALYSDKVAITDSDGGSIAGRLAKMSAAERAAWAADIAAQSSHSMSFVSEVSRSENDDNPGESLSESPGTGFLMRLIKL